MASIASGESTVVCSAVVAPKATLAPALNPVPWMSITSPPSAGPVVSERPETAGVGGAGSLGQASVSTRPTAGGGTSRGGVVAVVQPAFDASTSQKPGSTSHANCPLASVVSGLTDGCITAEPLGGAA